MLLSCSKKQDRARVIKNVGDVENMFQLKNYKTQVKKKINDSITHIRAEQDYFILTGDFNTKMNTKTGIWSLKNKTDTKEIQVDYIIFDRDDVFKNQIIFKEHNKIDSSTSKFYIVKDKSLKSVQLKFFSPKIQEELSKEAKVMYTIHRNRKVVKTDSIVYKNVREGKYLADIKYNFKKGDDVSGYFSEIVMAKSPNNKDSLIMGNNSIYFIERF